MNESIKERKDRLNVATAVAVEERICSGFSAHALAYFQQKSVPEWLCGKQGYTKEQTNQAQSLLSVLGDTPV